MTRIQVLRSSLDAVWTSYISGGAPLIRNIPFSWLAMSRTMRFCSDTTEGLSCSRGGDGRTEGQAGALALSQPVTTVLPGYQGQRSLPTAQGPGLWCRLERTLAHLAPAHSISFKRDFPRTQKQTVHGRATGAKGPHTVSCL